MLFHYIILLLQSQSVFTALLMRWQISIIVSVWLNACLYLTDVYYCYITLFYCFSPTPHHSWSSKRLQEMSWFSAGFSSLGPNDIVSSKHAYYIKLLWNDQFYEKRELNWTIAKYSTCQMGQGSNMFIK